MAIQDEIKKKTPKVNYELDDFGKRRKKSTGIFPKKGDSSSEVGRKIIFLAAILVLILSGIILFNYYKSGWDTQKENSNLASKYSSHLQSIPPSESTSGLESSEIDNTPLPILSAAEELLKINPDAAGYVEVPNTNIKLPVVLAKDEPIGEENTFYLTHKFSREKSRAGAIFADFRTTITDRKQSDNIVLYGHNEANNTMFGDLDKYKDNSGKRFNNGALEFYKQNPTFTFNTNYELGTYKIFAYFVTAVDQTQDKTTPVFDYVNYIDFDKSRYDSFIENIESRNMISTDIDYQFGDKFVTLSTCSNEFTPSSRFVLFGRKVRPGEDPTVNTANVTYSENPLEPNWDEIYNR